MIFFYRKLSKKFKIVFQTRMILKIIVGRLYNTFFYQTKRILKRDPTKKEFEDFLKFVENKKPDLEHLW
jgi:hypothetical protein